MIEYPFRAARNGRPGAREHAYDIVNAYGSPLLSTGRWIAEPAFYHRVATVLNLLKDVPTGKLDTEFTRTLVQVMAAGEDAAPSFSDYLRELTEDKAVDYYVPSAGGIHTMFSRLADTLQQMAAGEANASRARAFQECSQMVRGKCVSIRRSM